MYRMAAPTVLDKEVVIIERRTDIEMNYIVDTIFGELGYEPELGRNLDFVQKVKLATGFIQGIVGDGPVTLKVVGVDMVVKTLIVIQGEQELARYLF